MISYTPYHKYVEVFDKPEVKRSISKRMLYWFIAIIIITFVIGGLVLCFRYLSLWDAISITLAVLGIGVIAIIIYVIINYEPPSKSKVASVIKSVIGYDFGEDFRLLHTSSHDYDEYLYIFSEESFEPLRLYLESVPDSDGEETGRSIRHEQFGKHVFYLCEDRLKDGCGSVESIIVDYEGRTLKHKFVVY